MSWQVLLSIEDSIRAILRITFLRRGKSLKALGKRTRQLGLKTYFPLRKSKLESIKFWKIVK